MLDDRVLQDGRPVRRGRLDANPSVMTINQTKKCRSRIPRRWTIAIFLKIWHDLSCLPLCCCCISIIFKKWKAKNDFFRVNGNKTKFVNKLFMYVLSNKQAHSDMDK